ncbi:MAG TPA: GNAT family N-acetyltransferase [Candidatus Angelobacter sp.]|jgi:CelD/BcsL family acetyltransferase involved in cellulose biosynthesis
MFAVQETIVGQALSTQVFAELCIKVCHSWDELEQFRESWNRLLQANPASSIFQTPEWLAAWWQAFGKEKKLVGLIFTDQLGRAVGIAPLCSEKRLFLGFPLQLLRMVGAGSGDSDALDFSVLPGYELACAQAFVAWLAENREWQLYAMETLPQNSQIAQYISQHAQKIGWSIDSTSTPNFVIELPPTWPQYLSTLESSFRPMLTRYPKRLQSRFSVRMHRCEQKQDLPGHLQTLFNLHQMRWTGRGQPGAFANADRCDFYFHMATAFLQKDWLEFWLLELDGETVGAQFCFRYNNMVSLLQEGFHPRYTAEKIGYALRAHVLEEMIRSGACRYDFLGGADPYKAKFGAHEASYLNLFMAGPSKRGRMYLAMQKGKRKFKLWLKSRLPENMLAVLRRERKSPVASAIQ